MSMISAQIDELRRMADGQVTYRDARAVMLQAADTIWQLCDDLQQANAENAKLRELVRILKNCADECGDCDTCPINGKSGVLNPWLGCDSLRDRMRELGVEVDG